MATWGNWAPNSITTKRMRMGMDLWYTGDPASGYVTVHRIIYAQCRYHFYDNNNTLAISGICGNWGPSTKKISFAFDDQVVTVQGEQIKKVALSSGSTTYVSASASYSGLDYIGTPTVVSVTVGLSLPAIPVTAPSAPTIGTNTRNSDTSNTITWTNNQTPNAYTNLYVERSVDGGAFVQIAALGVVTSYVDTTTTANHSYHYRVRASNSGKYSSYSASSNTTYNTPAAPSDCQASHTAPGSITVQWADKSMTETAFDIDRSNDDGATWTTIGAAAAAATSYIDTSVTSGTYLYRVRATRGALVSGYSASSESVTIPVGVSFTATHTVVRPGLLVRARYSVEYANTPKWNAMVKIYHGGIADELIFDGVVAPDTDIPLLHETTADESTITMVVTTYEPIVDGAWSADFYESVDDNTWTFLGYADDQLVGMTANLQLWTGGIGEFTLANARLLESPAALEFADLSVAGSLTISATQTATTPYRISVCHTILNKYGPTLPSDPLTFWASHPTIEWTASNYAIISGTVLNAVGITAVELYFTEDEYQEFAFLWRVNIPEIDSTIQSKPWSFNWIGYQLDTSMWTIANLTVPTENYTLGAPASKMAALDGRLYFWGGDPAYRIWIGGNPGNRFSVSPGTGGGFVDAEPGSGTIVKNILKFKTQQGAAIVTALCDNPNSQKEHRFNLVETNLSLSNEQSAQSWQAEKIAGTVGCKSSNGALATGDGLYAVSRYGLALTTLTMEYNSQLQVMYVSDPISPVFLKQYGNQLSLSVLFEVNGVLYMTFGSPDAALDNIIFCYDIGLKAWWTYTIDVDEPILNMIHIDYEGTREGIGIITRDAIYLLPTTIGDTLDAPPDHYILIESGELSTMQPLQSMHHISQLELRFDYFIGELDVIITMIDQFGRTIMSEKRISHDTLQHQLSEYIRIDQVVESYKIVMTGQARMRLTHFLAKIYPKSNRIGMVYGFDSRQSHSSSGSIHRTFASYNDLREAIIP